MNCRNEGDNTCKDVLCFLEFGGFSEWCRVKWSWHSQGESQQEHRLPFWPCRQIQRNGCGIEHGYDNERICDGIDMFICGMWTGFYQVLHQEFLYGWPNGSEISDVDSGQIGVTMACWRVLYISLCPVSHVLQKKVYHPTSTDNFNSSFYLFIYYNRQRTRRSLTCHTAMSQCLHKKNQ